MYKKTKVVLFQEGKIPQIFTNPDIKKVALMGDILINPKLPKKAPPHLWKLERGKIVVENDIDVESRIVVSKAPVRTPEKLERDINRLEEMFIKEVTSIINIMYYREQEAIDKHNKLCNITMLGALLLIFLGIILHLDDINILIKQMGI